jgi:hypothetical protein
MEPEPTARATADLGLNHLSASLGDFQHIALELAAGRDGQRLPYCDEIGSAGTRQAKDRDQGRLGSKVEGCQTGGRCSGAAEEVDEDRLAAQHVLVDQDSDELVAAKSLEDGFGGLELGDDLGSSVFSEEGQIALDQRIVKRTGYDTQWGDRCDRFSRNLPVPQMSGEDEPAPAAAEDPADMLFAFDPQKQTSLGGAETAPLEGVGRNTAEVTEGFLGHAAVNILPGRSPEGDFQVGQGQPAVLSVEPEEERSDGLSYRKTKGSRKIPEEKAQEANPPERYEIREFHVFSRH